MLLPLITSFATPSTHTTTTTITTTPWWRAPPTTRPPPLLCHCSTDFILLLLPERRPLQPFFWIPIVCTATDLQNDGSIRVWNLEKFTPMRRQNCKNHENSTWTVPVASWHSARYPTRKKDKNHNKFWKTGLKCSPTLSGNTRSTGPLLLLGWICLGRLVLVLCLVIKAQISSSASLKRSFRVELERRSRVVIFCVFAHRSQSDSAHCSSPLLQQYLAKLRGSSVSAISLSSRLPYIFRGFLSPLVLICCFQAALFLIQVYHPCFEGIREKTSRVSKPLPTQ